MRYEKVICVFILQMYIEMTCLSLQTASAMRRGCSKGEEILQERKTNPWSHKEMVPNLLSALLIHSQDLTCN